MDYREKRDKVWADATRGKDDLSLPEFLAVPSLVPADGDTWGKWTFRRDTLLLEYRNGDDDYEIDLEELGGPTGLVITMKHISEKCYISAGDIGNLFFAVHDLCGAWYTPETDIAALIRKRYGFDRPLRRRRAS